MTFFSAITSLSFPKFTSLLIDVCLVYLCVLFFADLRIYELYFVLVAVVNYILVF